MLLTQFILQDLHFALNIFAALVFFAVSWLYLDAFTQTKSYKDLFKVLGFSVLSLSFLIHATYIEQASLTNAIFISSYTETIANLLKFSAYILLILGLLTDPIQKKPADAKKIVLTGFFLPISLSGLLWYVSFPLLSLFIFLLYIRKSVIGLENHLKPLTVGFFFIFLYELLSVLTIFESTNTISIYKIVQPFGQVWFISHIFLILGTVIIARWIFGYLLKRLQTQLFMIMNVVILAVFLVTTISFTGLLLNNLQTDALSHLVTDVDVVQYAISSKQAETLSDAEVVSQNSDLQKAISAKDTKTLKTLSTNILLAKKQAFLIILSKDGIVIMRGEDNEKIGDSLSNDPLFVRAIKGGKVSSVITKDGPIAPIVSIRSAVPIVENGENVGVVIVGTDIDNAFVDGLKSSTHLDVSVYADNKLSATTFIAPDGKSRFIGVKEEDKNVNKNVLIEGKNYSSEVNILNVPYFAAYAPLKDIDRNPVGMLFVGQEEISVIQAASKSAEYTFLIAVLFILLSILPSFVISKYIANQFK